MTHFQLSLLPENNQLQSSETDSNDWYTPVWVIQAIEQVMGWIDLDPASCAQANRIVKAKRFFSKEDNALSQDWMNGGSGNVWLNPPYSMPEIGQFVYRFLEEWKEGAVDQGCILTRNATETQWCQRLLRKSDRFCLLNKRVSFWHPEKPVGQDKCGHIIFYFGENTEEFERVFAAHGLVFVGGGTQR